MHIELTVPRYIDRWNTTVLWVPKDHTNVKFTTGFLRPNFLVVNRFVIDSTENETKKFGLGKPVVILTFSVIFEDPQNRSLPMKTHMSLVELYRIQNT
jgi:hypothetical protein